MTIRRQHLKGSIRFVGMGGRRGGFVDEKRIVLIVGLGLVATGCSYQGAVRRPSTGPRLTASGAVAVVADRPANGIWLGTVTVRGNSWTSSAGCESEAAAQSKRLGATHVVVRPTGRGNQCTAQAYVMGDVPTAIDPRESQPVGVSVWRYAAVVLIIAAVAFPIGFLVGKSI